MAGRQNLINLSARAVLSLKGAETGPFLQRLVTADMDALDGGDLIYSALLTPQGKISFDFFIGQQGDAVLIDCEAVHAEEFLRKLMMYRMRAPIEIAREDGFAVVAALPSGNEDTADLPADPRHPDMGARAILAKDAVPEGATADESAYTEHRIGLGIAEGRAELGFEELFALEANLDLLNGMSLKKGCFVGQELAARMTHRGSLKKRLLSIEMEGAAEVGDELHTDGKRAGKVRALSGKRGIALLRLEYLEEPLETAAGAKVTPLWPDWIPAPQGNVDAQG